MLASSLFNYVYKESILRDKQIDESSSVLYTTEHSQD